MSVLQLQIEIDSDVHPELHAILMSIARSEARTERLRQLAAAGLIWEHLRAQVKLPPPAHAADRPEREPATTPLAEPTRPADEAIAAGSAAREMPPGVIPVLWDAIDVAALLPSGAMAERGASRPEAARHVVPGSARAAESGPGPEASPAVESASRRAELPSDRGGESREVVAIPSSRKSGTRPRLLRMREKGLFQNGADN